MNTPWYLSLSILLLFIILFSFLQPGEPLINLWNDDNTLTKPHKYLQIFLSEIMAKFNTFLPVAKSWQSFTLVGIKCFIPMH